MSLSLELKKFINSEHTGSYVTIMIPIDAGRSDAPRREERRDAGQAEAYGAYAQGQNPAYGAYAQGQNPGYGGAQDGGAYADGGKPYAGGAQPYAGGGQAYAGGGQAYAGSAQPYADGAQPYAGSGQAYAGGAQPYADGAQAYAGGQVYAGGTDPYAQAADPYAAGYAQQQQQRAEGARPAPRRRYEPVRIHYTEEGDGEPLILLHTVGQSSYTWRKVFFRLRQHYRVIVPDLPGHGYSDRPVHFDYTVGEQAMVLRLFMDALGIESAHLAGFSMGAVYALQFVLDCPSRVGRLVLLTPGGVTEDMPTPVKLIDSALFGAVASRLYGMRTVRKLLEECVFDLTNIDDEVVREYYKPASDAPGRRAIRMSLQNFDEQPVFPYLREIACPVLILQGSEDRWHKSTEVELFHQAIRGALFSVVRNVGHLIHEEKPDRFVAALLEFIPVPMPGD